MSQENRELTPFSERDDDLIVAELEGRYIEEFVYSFQQAGKTVTGLSWKGVQEAAREMGGIQVPMEKMKITETDTQVSVLVEAFDSNRDSSRLGFASQPKEMSVKGVLVPDPFCYQKAISKAQRNAMIQLIPQLAIKAWIEKRLSKSDVPPLPGNGNKKASKPASPPEPSPENLPPFWIETPDGEKFRKHVHALRGEISAFCLDIRAHTQDDTKTDAGKERVERYVERLYREIFGLFEVEGSKDPALNERKALGIIDRLCGKRDEFAAQLQALTETVPDTSGDDDLPF